VQNLTEARAELFQRSPDECFESLASLNRRCADRRTGSMDLWHPPNELMTRTTEGRLEFGINDQSFELNDWSFSQLCRFAGVSKDTVNRVSAATASRIFGETLNATEIRDRTVRAGMRSLRDDGLARRHLAVGSSTGERSFLITRGLALQVPLIRNLLDGARAGNGETVAARCRVGSDGT